LCWQQQLDKQAIREDFALLAIQKQNKKRKEKTPNCSGRRADVFTTGIHIYTCYVVWDI
jgi:hypothetical protein